MYFMRWYEMIRATTSTLWKICLTTIDNDLEEKKAIL